MKYIEAITKFQYKYQDKDNKSLFLAGGITNCPNWQKETVKLLKNTDLIIYNPRRENFPINDPNASFEQIKWEHKYLRESNMVLFWFSRGSLNPIVLFELGRWSSLKLNKKIFVGVDPKYERKQDVEIQLRLERPEIEIVYSLSEVSKQIIDYIR